MSYQTSQEAALACTSIDNKLRHPRLTPGANLFIGDFSPVKNLF